MVIEYIVVDLALPKQHPAVQPAVCFLSLASMKFAKRYQLFFKRLETAPGMETHTRLYITLLP